MSERWGGEPSQWLHNCPTQSSPTGQYRHPGAIATPPSLSPCRHTGLVAPRSPPPQRLHHTNYSHPLPDTPPYYHHQPVSPAQTNHPLNYHHWSQSQFSYTQMEAAPSLYLSEQTTSLSSAPFPDPPLTEHSSPLVSNDINQSEYPSGSNAFQFPLLPSIDVSPDHASQSVPSSPVPVWMMKKEEEEEKEKLPAVDPHSVFLGSSLNHLATTSSICPNPGSYGFKLHFRNTSETKSSQTGWLFSEEENLLFVSRKNEFAVMLTTKVPLPPDCFLRVSISYEDPSRLQEIGPVTRCLKHLEEDKDLNHSEHFVRSKNPEATYGKDQGHCYVNIPLSALAESEEGKVCVLSYSCFSSCLSNKSTPSLVTVVRVMGDNCTELGQASFGVRICACPARDKRKLIANRRKGPSTSTPPASKRRASSVKEEDKDEEEECERDIHPTLDLVGSTRPDDNGYYTFTWKTKNKFLYNFLLMMKTGCQTKKNTS